METLLKSIVKEKCPKCGHGNVFLSKGNAFLFETPKMNISCSDCSFKFEKEPGYFIGAMYVSYGLGLLEMVIAWLLAMSLGIDMEYAIYGLMILIILMSAFNYRKARIIWMYFV